MNPFKCCKNVARYFGDMGYENLVELWYENSCLSDIESVLIDG